jgi:hypothetical protein
MLASWALHRHDHANKALSLIGPHKVVELSTLCPYILENDANPMDALEGLFAMCEDVDCLVEVYAHSTAAAIEQYANPWVEYSPIKLSTTEFTRLAHTFWMLRVFYQLQLLFAHHESAQPFVQRFISDLQPWQVKQCLSVELFLASSGFSATSSVYTLIGNKNGARSGLQRTSRFFQSYIEVANVNMHDETKRRLTTFTLATYFVAERDLTPVPWLRSQPRLVMEVGREGFEYSVSQLRNDGWMIYESVRQHDPVRPQEYYQFFSNMGIFFWDLDRLADWELIDVECFPEIVHEFRNRLRIMAKHRYQDCCGCCW